MMSVSVSLTEDPHKKSQLLRVKSLLEASTAKITNAYSDAATNSAHNSASLAAAEELKKYT